MTASLEAAPPAFLGINWPADDNKLESRAPPFPCNLTEIFGRGSVDVGPVDRLGVDVHWVTVDGRNWVAVDGLVLKIFHKIFEKKIEKVKIFDCRLPGAPGR